MSRNLLTRSRALRGLALALLVLASACVDKEEASAFGKRDFMRFQREVYPVLLRDCAFSQCHGASERFFRVWGPGRERLASPMSGELPEAFALPAGHELSTSYALALSMIDEAHPTRSLLLRKPLAIEAGGAGHLGVDKYGRDVYRTKQDAGYIALARWVSQPDEAGAGGAGGKGGTGGGGGGGAGHAGSGGRSGSGGMGGMGGMGGAGGSGGSAGGGGAGIDGGVEPMGGADGGAGVGGSGGSGGEGGMGGMGGTDSNPYRGCTTPADCNPSDQCLTTASFPTNATVCQPSCIDVGDCPVPDGTYEAVVTCVTGNCRIDCTPVLFGALLTCPTGMTCIAPFGGAAYCHDDGM